METSIRKHAEYHERRLEQQMLDALLRIEEILLGRNEPAVEGNVEDTITHITPTETPFSKVLKGKRR